MRHLDAYPGLGVPEAMTVAQTAARDLASLDGGVGPDDVYWAPQYVRGR